VSVGCCLLYIVVLASFDATRVSQSAGPVELLFLGPTELRGDKRLRFESQNRDVLVICMLVLDEEPYRIQLKEPTAGLQRIKKGVLRVVQLRATDLKPGPAMQLQASMLPADRLPAPIAEAEEEEEADKEHQAALFLSTLMHSIIVCLFL